MHTHTPINARYTLTSVCGCRFQTLQERRCRFQTPQDRDPLRVCLAQPANTPTSHRLSRAGRARLMLRRPWGARPSPTVLATPARRGLMEALAHYVLQESTSLRSGFYFPEAAHVGLLMHVGAVHVVAVQARTPLQIGPRVGPAAHRDRFIPERHVSTVPQVSLHINPMYSFLLLYTCFTHTHTHKHTHTHTHACMHMLL